MELLRICKKRSCLKRDGSFLMCKNEKTSAKAPVFPVKYLCEKNEITV